MTKAKERALASLLTHSNMKDAALAAGIDPRTLRRYMNDTEFLAEYRKAFTRMFEEATRAAQRALLPAIATLREVCEDHSISAMARIAAARCILDMGLKLTEMNDIELRLEALENARNY